ncbi:MAG: toast rack family protein [Calditrichaceae bacterium]
MTTLNAVASVFLAVVFASTPSEKIRKNYPLDGLESADINISFGAGRIEINSGNITDLYQGNFEYTETEPDVQITANRNFADVRIAQNEIRTKKDEKSDLKIRNFENFSDNNWNITLTNRIPIDLDLELGASKSYLNLGGLKLENINIETGLSKTELDFSTLNPVPLSSLVIDAGISKFTGRRLLNSRFRKFIFNGGVGDYKLEFDGEFTKEANIDINVDLGSILIIIPKSVPYRARIGKSVLSSAEIDYQRRTDDIYYSAGYDRDKPALNINLESGIGSVKILHR